MSLSESLTEALENAAAAGAATRRKLEPLTAVVEAREDAERLIALCEVRTVRV